MDSSKMTAKELPPFISKITKGQKVTRQWILKDWQTEHEKLVDLAYCPITFEAFADFQINLGFKRPKSDSSKIFEYLQLWAFLPNQKKFPSAGIVAFNISVESDCVGTLPISDLYVPLKYRENVDEVLIDEEFLLYKRNGNLALQQDEIKIRVTLEPLYFQEKLATSQLLLPSGPADNSNLSVDQKTEQLRDQEKTLETEQRFEYVAFLTNDSKIHGQKRSIISEASPVLRDIIADNMKDPYFDGNIIMENLDWGHLNEILEWIENGRGRFYFGNKTLQDLTGILKTADDFQIWPNELKQTLGKELIGKCAKKNMFELYNFAKGNKMEKAMVQIADFIKTNM